MDNAFERARAAYGTGAYDDATLEFLFPQLKESEDERIRKAILGLTYLDGIEPILTKCSITAGDIRTYLEKQKENIEMEYVFRPMAGTDITVAAEKAIRRANEGDRLVLAFNGAYIPVRKGCNANKIVDIYDAFIEKQKEPKPAVTHGETYHVDTLGTQQVIAGKMPQKPAGWSEEDAIRLEDVITLVEHHHDKEYNWFDYDDLATWLKDLRSHPKSSDNWKPSEEQMEALDSARFCKFYDRSELDSLYEQLKKMM